MGDSMGVGDGKLRCQVISPSRPYSNSHLLLSIWDFLHLRCDHLHIEELNDCFALCFSRLLWGFQSDSHSPSFICAQVILPRTLQAHDVSREKGLSTHSTRVL